MALIRQVHPDTLVALDKTFFPVLLVYIDWPGGAVRAHSNIGTINWGGNDWLGIGGLGGVDVPPEGDLVPTDASVWVLGSIDQIAADMAVPVADLRGRDCEIFMGVTTSPGGLTLIGEPASLFAGYLDQRSLQTQNGDAAVSQKMSLSFATGPSARAAARLTHSHEDQQVTHPGDTLFRHLAFMSARIKKPAVW